MDNLQGLHCFISISLLTSYVGKSEAADKGWDLSLELVNQVGNVRHLYQGQLLFEIVLNQDVIMVKLACRWLSLRKLLDS